MIEPLESRCLLSAVPAPLTSTDVGNPAGGSADFTANNQTYSIVGSGFDIYGNADAFHYVYEPLTGDGTVTVQVTSDSANADKSLAGLNIRDTLSTTAPNLWIAARDGGSVFVDSRQTSGTFGGNDIQNVPGSIPEFLRITRTGNTVVASYSTDGGNTYQTLVTRNISFSSSTVLVGMAVSSQDAPGTLATATFANFSVVPASPGAATLSAPPVSNAVTTPYQFTVTYTSATGVNASTVGSNNWIVTLPDGSTEIATLVTSGLTNGSPLTATYQVPRPTLAGTYSVSAGSSPVQNLAGGQIGATGTLGTFDVTESSSIVGTLKSAAKVKSKTPKLYKFTVTYTATNSKVNPLRLGNNNWVVQSPGGALQATLLATKVKSAAAVIVATYSVPTPTTNGIYTIQTSIDRAANLLGAQVAVGSIGTFVVAIPQKKG